MNYIDLFAGAGGLSEGFIQAGFTPIAHVEMDAGACYSLRTRVAYHYLRNRGKYDLYIAYLKGDIDRQELYRSIPTELLASVINLPIGEENNESIYRAIESQPGNKEVDVIIGGPPCQAYSIAGRGRSETSMKNDPRNYLYIQYCKYLEKYQPKLFVFENVIGLKSAGNGIHLQNMQKLFKSNGYSIELFTVDAYNFGVLQSRKRLIIIGWKDDFIPNLPDLEAIHIQNEFSVQDVLNDLPFLQTGEGVNKYMQYRTNGNAYLESRSIRNEINVLTQHVARPHTEQHKAIYRIAVEKWNAGRERLNYNDLPDHLKTHSSRDIFRDRFKVVAADLPYSHTVVAHIAKEGNYYIHPDIQQNRSITIREAARLQSFPDDYYFEGVKSKGNWTTPFKQIGNAVPPLMARGIAEGVRKCMKNFEDL